MNKKGGKLKDSIVGLLFPMRDYVRYKPEINLELKMKAAKHMKLLSVGVFLVVLLFAFVDSVFIEDSKVYLLLNLARIIFSIFIFGAFCQFCHF